MIVEERVYTLQVGRVAPFLKYYEANGLPIQKRILGNLIGYFFTEIGTLNQVIQLWGYADLADRTRRRAELAADASWAEYLKNQPPVVVSQENRILTPAPFSPIR
jgi:NIPSNAP